MPTRLHGVATFASSERPSELRRGGPMPTCPDFEIGLHRQDVDGYAMELRFSQPESEADIRLVSLVQFDLDGLRALALDAAAYGRLLSQSLFADPAVQSL